MSHYVGLAAVILASARAIMMIAAALNDRVNTRVVSLLRAQRRR